MRLCNHCGLGIYEARRTPTRACIDGSTHFYHLRCYMSLPDAPFTPKGRAD